MTVLLSTVYWFRLRSGDMAKPTFDPGLTQQYTGILRRAINKDGSFNVARRGTGWRDIHPYLHLISMSWPTFLALVFAAYLGVNSIFAVFYYSLGPGHLQGGDAPRNFDRFLNAFFFSAHTLTTVGYGNIAPGSISANVLAVIEALIGLLGFALATGILFGRFSRPSARIGFSERALIAPYETRTSLQFRIVNRRPNALMEMEATVILMGVEGEPGKQKRTFQGLTLERDTVDFLALTWTVVHPIDESSPLFGKTEEDLERKQAEVLILIKGFDETFAQTVHARYSYRFDEIAWNAKFAPAFDFDETGSMVLNIDKVGNYASVGPAA
jgi:inward rectifier potassium channel